MINLLKEIRGLLTSLFIFTKYIISKQSSALSEQAIIIKNNNPFNNIKEYLSYFIKGISVYRRSLLIINILAFINLIFTIIIIIAFSNIELEGFYLITLLSSIFIKFAPVFIQEILFNYYFTITSFIQVKIREIIINMINLDKVEITSKFSDKTERSLIGQDKLLSDDSSPLRILSGERPTLTFDPNSLREEDEIAKAIFDANKKDDRCIKCIWFAIGLLAIGVFLYFAYYTVEVNRKGGGDLGPNSGDDFINKSNSFLEGQQVLPIKEKIVEEISKTQSLTEKFKFWNYFKGGQEYSDFITENVIDPINSSTNSPASFEITIAKGEGLL
jgi:hypothetical protein